jgi:phosphoketolase
MTTIQAHRDLSSESEGSTIRARPLSADELARIHAYWRAANYLSVGQIYLLNIGNRFTPRAHRIESPLCGEMQLHSR